MKINLIVLNSGKSAGQTIPINLSQFVIGRDQQCQLRPASPAISKRHCALLVRDGKVLVRDFDSTNGTFVNDQPIKGEVELHHEDRLRVGPLTFSVKIEASPPVNKPTPPPAPKKSTAAADDDDIAAMLLSIEDGSPVASSPPGEIPEGSTVLDMVAPKTEEGQTSGAEPGKEDKAAKPKALGNTSTAAKALLDKYMRRPRG